MSYTDIARNVLYESSVLGIDTAVSVEVDAAAGRATGDHPARTAAWLKAARKQRGLTQKALALATGIAISTVANIEQGQRRGSVVVWTKLEGYLSNNS